MFYLADCSTLLEGEHVDGFGGIYSTSVDEVLKPVEVQWDIVYLVPVCE